MPRRRPVLALSVAAGLALSGPLVLASAPALAAGPGGGAGAEVRTLELPTGGRTPLAEMRDGRLVGSSVPTRFAAEEMVGSGAARATGGSALDAYRTWFEAETARSLTALGAAGLPDVEPEPEPAPEEGFGFSFTSPGFADDGGPALLQGRYTQAPDGAVTVDLAHRAGGDGALLWRRQVTDDAFPVTSLFSPTGRAMAPVRLGPAARPGVLLVSSSFTDTSTPTEESATIRLGLEALDGSGTTVWEYAAEGVLRYDRVTDTFTATDVPFLQALLGGTVATVPTRVLVGLSSSTFSPEGSSATDDLLLLAGSDGGADVLVSDLGSDFGAFASNATDLTLDGLEDFQLTFSRFDEPSGGTTTEARDGIDGDVLWQRTDDSFSFGGSPLGDLDGDGRSELGVSVFGPEEAEVLVLRGSDGGELFSRPGDFVTAAGVGRFQVATGRFDDEEVSLTLTGYDGAGAELVRAVRSLGFDGEGDVRFAGIGLFSTGDVQPDGVVETGYFLDTFVGPFEPSPEEPVEGERSGALAAQEDGNHDGDGFASRVGVVDGASGVDVPGSERGQGYDGAFDGVGDDALELTDDGSGATTVATLHGVDGSSFWSTVVPGFVFSLAVVELTPDACADPVVLSSEETGETLRVLDGATGLVVWSATQDGDAVAGPGAGSPACASAPTRGLPAPVVPEVPVAVLLPLAALGLLALGVRRARA